MKKKDHLQNIYDLRESLSELYQQTVCDNNIPPVIKLRELTNIAGKVISASKAQLVYEIHRKKQRDIDFFEKQE